MNFYTESLTEINPCMEGIDLLFENILPTLRH